VLGDLFGRKRLLVIGAIMLAVGEAVALLTPGLGASTGTRVLVLWIGVVAALLVVLALGGGARQPMIAERSLSEEP
jgi:MFS family permease